MLSSFLYENLTHFLSLALNVHNLIALSSTSHHWFFSHQQNFHSAVCEFHIPIQLAFENDKEVFRAHQIKKKDKVCPFQGKNTWNYTFLGNDKSWQKNLVNRYLSFRLGVFDEILLTSWVMWNLKQKYFKKEKKFLL